MKDIITEFSVYIISSSHHRGIPYLWRTPTSSAHTLVRWQGPGFLCGGPNSPSCPNGGAPNVFPSTWDIDQPLDPGPQIPASLYSSLPFLSLALTHSGLATLIFIYFHFLQHAVLTSRCSEPLHALSSTFCGHLGRATLPADLSSTITSSSAFTHPPNVAEIQPLWTRAGLNLKQRVLGEIEINNFIALPGKGCHSGLI